MMVFFTTGCKEIAQTSLPIAEKGMNSSVFNSNARFNFRQDDQKNKICTVRLVKSTFLVAKKRLVNFPAS